MDTILGNKGAKILTGFLVSVSRPKADVNQGE